jgi:hypothetical protein
MRRIRPIAIALLAAGLSLPAWAMSHEPGEKPTGAHETSTQAATPPSDAAEQAPPQASSASGMEVRGTVEGLRIVQIQGTPHPHLVARVKTDQEQTKLLDLGAIVGLREREKPVQKGQRIEARGREGRLGETSVVIVDRFAGDGVVTVVPMAADTPPQREMARQGAAADRRIAGEVVDARDVRLAGVPEAHRLLKVRTRQGEHLVVDLGPEGAQSLRIEKGDMVAARGTVGRLNDKPVLFADRIAEVARIERGQAQMAETGASPVRAGAASQGQGADARPGQAPAVSAGPEGAAAAEPDTGLQSR